MGKDNASKGKKDLQRLIKAKSTVALRSHRILQDANKLFQSLKNLIYFFLLSAVGQCRNVLVAGKKQIVAAYVGLERRYRRLRLGIKQTYKNIVIQSLVAARQKLVVLRLKISRQYRRARIETRRVYKSFVARCHQELVLARKKIALKSRRIGSGIKQAHRNLVSKIRQDLAAKQQKIAKGYQKVLSKARRAHSDLIKQSLRAVAAMSLGIARVYLRARIGTRKGYRNFVDRCHQELVLARQKIGLNYRRVCGGVKGAYHDLVSKIRQDLADKKQKIANSYQKCLSKARRAHSHLIKQSLRAVAGLRRQRCAMSLGIARVYLRARIGTRKGYRNFVSRCHQELVLAREKIALKSRQVRSGVKGAYQDLISKFRQDLAVKKQKTANRYQKVLSKAGRAKSNFIKQGQRCFAAFRRQRVNAGRNYRRTLVLLRRTYRNGVRFYNKGRRALQEGLYEARLNIGRQYRRTLVLLRRTYRNTVKSYNKGRRALQGELYEARSKIGRHYLRTLVKIRRCYRSFVIKSLRARAAAKQSIATLRQNLLKDYHKTLSTAKEIKVLAENDVERDFAVATKRMASSVQSSAEWFRELFPRKSRASNKKFPSFFKDRRGDRMSRESRSWGGPFKRIQSFFSQFMVKFPLRGQRGILKRYNEKPWFDLFLIVGSSLFVLIVSYLIPDKYRIINLFNSPNIALGNWDEEANPVKGNTDNQSPLASIPYFPKTNKDKNVKADKPHGYSFWPKRVTLRHVEGWGEGVSFGTDYSTLALLFATDYRVGRVMPMLDLRGHRFDNNTYAANVGIGGRYIPTGDGFCQILGMNVYYDWREGKLGDFQQIGVGLEVLGKRWDLRANGYAPISVKKRKLKCVYNQYEGDYYAINRQCEYTSYGYNAEVGYYAVRGKNFLLYAAGGPYYLVRKHHNKTGGGEFRLRPQYKDYLALDFSVSHDNVFGTVYQAQVILYLPLYQLSKHINKRPCGISDQQIYQPIERFEVMPLGRRCCWQSNF